MPTYDYSCDACGHQFEEFQSYSEPVLTKCPSCRKNKLRRLFGTGAAVLFKGSGFYETDYRSDSYKTGAKADTESTKSAESATDAKTETKAEAPAKPAKSTKTKASTSKD
jgi:putative FmdB family regulatory protein